MKEVDKAPTVEDLHDLDPFVEGLAEFDLAQVDSDERAKFFASLWEFGSSLTRRIDTRQGFPTESEIIRTAAERLNKEPDFFTSDFLPATVVEKVTREISEGRDLSRKLWELSAERKIICSSYRDELGREFVRRISAARTP